MIVRGNARESIWEGSGSIPSQAVVGSFYLFILFVFLFCFSLTRSDDGPRRQISTQRSLVEDPPIIVKNENLRQDGGKPR